MFFKNCDFVVLHYALQFDASIICSHLAHRAKLKNNQMHEIKALVAHRGGYGLTCDYVGTDRALSASNIVNTLVSKTVAPSKIFKNK